jgi:uncharacterized protein (TIGR02757 family)
MPKLKLLSKRKILELKPQFDSLVEAVEVPSYIDRDPVQFLHAFQEKSDIEIAGFFTAIMAWGRRDIVIAKVDDLLQRMDYKPTEFIGNFSESDAVVLDGFKHRTFKPIDHYWFIKTMQSILLRFHSFEAFWAYCKQKADSEHRELMSVFNEQFFSFHPEIPQRSHKHISNPDKGGSCKRLYMYLRWTVRKSVVDVGIMNFIKPAELKIPLDVHVARQARAIGLLSRKQNDWKSVLELNEKLKILDPNDPSKYDYALFGLGVHPELVDDKIYLNSLA